MGPPLPLPTVTEQTIAGLYLVGLVSNVLGEDARGTFREAWQNQKMTDGGLPEFKPVQYNVAESRYGVVRGIHAEPWDKYVHIVTGEVFGAWVDLRPDSPSFGQTVTATLDSSNAIYVPRGVGNSYAVTSEHAAYTYLVNEHWSPEATYQAVAYDDPDLAIEWPVPPAERIVSDKDRANPTFKGLFPNA